MTIFTGINWSNENCHASLLEFSGLSVTFPNNKKSIPLYLREVYNYFPSLMAHSHFDSFIVQLQL